MKFLSLWRCAWLVGSAALGVASHAASTTHPACPIPADGASTPELTPEQLKAAEADCLLSAPYYRHLAAWWLTQGAAHKAQEALERALLLEPGHLPTQWQYAQTLHLLGDTPSAQQLLAQLDQNPDLPVPLRQALQAPVATLPNGHGWAYRLGAAVSAVADSNLNNAAPVGELTLTLPQGNVTLPLAPAFRRQSGLAAVGQLQWSAIRAWQQQLWLLQADVRHRQTSSSAQNYTQLETAATWLQAPDAPRQWLGRAHLSQLVWGSDSLYNGARLGLQHQWRLNPCRLAWGAETEWRRYPVAANLNGRYWGSSTSLHCQNDSTQQQWQLHWRAGVDTPSPTAPRAGGRYRQQDWRLAWGGPLGAGRLAWDYQYTRQADASGYSPLLANNATRRQSRHAWALEYSQPMPGSAGWQWFAGLEISRQRSNLAVFSADRHALVAGLRWQNP